MASDLVWHFLFWLYVAATLSQLALWLFFGGNWKLEIGNSKPEGKQPLPPTPQFPISNFQFPISLIMCARNEAANLRRHLPLVLEQQYAGEWELVVVDDASEDDTAAVLRDFQRQYARLRVLRIAEKTGAGKKHALAQGIAAARHECLLLSDADCRPASPHWLAHMAAALHENPQTALVLGYGPMTPGPGLLNGWVRYETAITAIHYLSFARAGMPYMGVGRNLAFKKHLYESAGGFEKHADLVSGDDDLLVNAVATASNTTICLHPEAFVYSDGKKTWREWARQKRRHLSAGKRYRPLHQAVLTAASLSQTLHFFLLMVLLAGGFGMVSAVVLFLARSFIVWRTLARLLPLLHESPLISRIPIYETLLTAYYGAFVPICLIAPQGARSAWK
jgi:hypothetical protein